ncbi:MAG: hypothetical protein MZV64_41000 [Ignavibacteriales bacterium]|nr:hypothetical protein [Ignavibacteriales bacterium]
MVMNIWLNIQQRSDCCHREVASVEIPADIVVLKVTLSFADKIDGKRAFELHKQGEHKINRVI